MSRRERRERGRGLYLAREKALGVGLIRTFAGVPEFDEPGGTMTQVLTDPKHQTPEQTAAQVKRAFRYAVALAVAAGVSKPELVRIVARGR